MTDDDDWPSEAQYDTGSGRWFVLAQIGLEWSLMAGPYQTEGGMKRWMNSYEAPAGLEHVLAVRCEGSWRNAVTHVERAITEIRRQIGIGQA